jgi:hypothetical protein
VAAAVQSGSEVLLAGAMTQDHGGRAHLYRKLSAG